jgi:PAS domain S-box-containing protein
MNPVSAAANGRHKTVPSGAQGSHLVQFYEDDDFLVDSIVRFVKAGLATGDPVLLVATVEHQNALCRQLASQGIDVASGQPASQLTLLNARETLDRIMMGGLTPDPKRFNEVVGGALATIAAARPNARVHVYGEMVDLLCRDGNAEAAIWLEQQWNELAKHHRFSLLCAYSLDPFAGEGRESLLERVCDQHAQMLPSESVTAAEAVLAPARTILRLQRRTRSLEAALDRRKESEAFRLLVASVTDYAIFMLDPRGVVATWNAGAEKIKGYRADEIVGQHFSRFYPRECVASGKCEYELEMASAQGRFEDEGWRCRKDGSLFWANVVITALRDERGTLVGFAKLTRDLTDRRRAEEERIRLAQAQEANRIKDEFLATMSHELRTPLNAILGWATLLAPRATDAYMSKAIATIERNARAQGRLIDDVLDLSRIVIGKLRIEVRQTDLAAIARDAIDVIRPAAEARTISIHLERFDAPVLLVGDPTRLQQVAWNLLSNAVKFTEPGGSISIRLEHDGASARLSIRDTGRGIDATFLPYVFDRFRQADNSTTRRVGGIGLGLAIARELAGLHGGTLGVESPGLGKGSTFTLELPTRTVARARGEGAGDDARSNGRTRLDGLRVLVIDDESDARDLLSAILEDRGALVAASASASEARACFDELRPDVVVSDMGMPDEDGYQLVRAIRALPKDRGGATPVVALTAYGGREHRRRGLEVGCNAYLVKPVDAEELANTVRGIA